MGEKEIDLKLWNALGNTEHKNNQDRVKVGTVEIRRSNASVGSILDLVSILLLEDVWKPLLFSRYIGSGKKTENGDVLLKR